MFFLFRCASAETLYFIHAVTRTFTECLPAEMHWEAAPKTHAKARTEVASTGGRIALSCGNKADDSFLPCRDAERRQESESHRR